MARCTASNDLDRPAASLDAARLLALAAAPTFAAMAAANALSADPAAPICASSGAAHLTGMTSMYALMAIFHLAPWLRLASCGRARSSTPKGETS